MHGRVGGHIGFPGSSVYVASKFAVLGLTKTAALEFAKQGIRVNSVSPGPIQTEMFDRAFGEGETEMKKTIATQTPVGRIGTSEEIADRVLAPDARRNDQEGRFSTRPKISAF